MHWFLTPSCSWHLSSQNLNLDEILLLDSSSVYAFLICSSCLNWGGSLNLIEYEIHEIVDRKLHIHSFWSSCWNCVIKETYEHPVREWTNNHGFGECWPQIVYVLEFLSCFKSFPDPAFLLIFLMLGNLAFSALKPNHPVSVLILRFYKS